MKRTEGQCDYYIKLPPYGSKTVNIEYSISRDGYFKISNDLLSSLPDGAEEITLSV